MSFLRLLLIFALIYFGMKFIRMFIVPFLFRKATDKMRTNMEGHMRDQQDRADSRAEGEVRVETKGKSNVERVDDGDYVEFEEVD